MMIIRKHIALLLMLLAVPMALPVSADDVKQKLFVNLASDNIDRAAMAIGFGTNVLKKKKITTTIFLSAQGVRWADKTIPQNRYANGKTVAEMMQDFMKSGGRIIICPMCMKNVGGMQKTDLLEGVELGGPDVTFPALFSDNTTVLSY